MSAAHRRQIEQAFSAAANYDFHARVQRLVADRLAERIAALPLPAAPRILEIGCGTGFLTDALVAQRPDARLLITDISPRMVERCRRRISESADRRFAVLDGEYGTPDDGPFDLVCSSLAMQWFDDQAAAIPRILSWLAPGGHCIFATLGAESFAEWRAAHRAEGIAPGTPEFPSRQEFTAMLPAEQASSTVVERHIERHESALDFMRSLKAIGAHTAARHHRPLPPSLLRKVMRNFEASGGTVSYDVVTCHYQRA